MLPKWIDAYMPPMGRCSLCGSQDARHRITDAAWQSLQAGESVSTVAKEYALPVEMVQRLQALKRPPSARTRPYSEHSFGIL